MHSRMSAAKTILDGTMRPTEPEFDPDCGISDLSVGMLTPQIKNMLNPLLKACARTEVSGGGVFTVYSQLGVKKRHHDGYLKPLFMDLEVYNRRQEKGRSLTHQIKGLAIAGAARILKIRTRRNRPVLSMYPRKLTKPNVSTWQAIVEVLRNAFIKAILPGFDRTAQGTAAQPDNYQDTR